ncbi:hypothetical protein [Chelatococcus reniformis]|uniref:Thiolase C-terminal domain-containing protein n=1 Tax=Chelatococcus reniformis TaxID=1494448 RepID=A0A916XK45_9HYPH|nr:hypothetical protein [Chelatococcus reniformis]GGC76499.1 hypothetical protein GCM10010994_38520 [Chelatococcus reniformis]
MAIGHPFAAARGLSQTVKELWSLPEGSLAIVGVCADGGKGTVVLLERGLTGRGPATEKGAALHAFF